MAADAMTLACRLRHGSSSLATSIAEVAFPQVLAQSWILAWSDYVRISLGPVRDFDRSAYTSTGMAWSGVRVSVASSTSLITIIIVLMDGDGWNGRYENAGHHELLHDTRRPILRSSHTPPRPSV